MTEFDPDAFEDKYVHYFTELQRAYKRAFEEMTDRHDSDLVHAIDQQILNESEPFYEGDGQFRIELPPDPVDRLDGAAIDPDHVGGVLDDYVDEIDRQLRTVFSFEA
jgi:hypothetical protein